MLKSENCDSSDDESLRSSMSIIFSSGKSSSPAWSRSSSMTSGTSTKSTTSSENKRKSKANFGPISRPTPTEFKSSELGEDSRVQQQNNQYGSLKVVRMKNKKKSFLPAQPKIVKPARNMPQPQGWITTTYYSGPMYGPPVYHCPHPITCYYPSPPPVQMPLAYTMPVPYPVSMLPSPIPPPLYSRMQVHHFSVQAHCTCNTWIYIDYA